MIAQNKVIDPSYNLNKCKNTKEYNNRTKNHNHLKNFKIFQESILNPVNSQ